MNIIKKAIYLIKEGRWFEGVIVILMVIGVIYFVNWWITGRWESKGKYSKDLQFPPKSKKSKKEVEIDFSQRILCSDGKCIGVINDQGVCNTCGKPYTKEPQ